MAEEPTSEERRAVRFEATVHPGEAGLGFAAMTERVADLDFDRLPDPGGEVRLVAGGDEVQTWFDTRIRDTGGGPEQGTVS